MDELGAKSGRGRRTARWMGSILAAGTLLAAARGVGQLPIPQPRPQPGPRPVPIPRPICLPGVNCGELHWDFEDRDGDGRGDLAGWTGSGSMLTDATGANRQPTFGASVSLRRMIGGRAADVPPSLRPATTVLALGGDYWDTGWPNGYQGTFWIGSAEARPTAGVPIDAVAGDDMAIGELISPEFMLQRGFVKFLASGTCGANVHVALERRLTRRLVAPDCSAALAASDAAHAAAQRACTPTPSARCAQATALDTSALNTLNSCLATPASFQDVTAPVWEAVRIPNGFRDNDPHQPLFVDYTYTPGGSCGENMTRVSWSTGAITRRGETATYRFHILDQAANGHVNADDFWVTDRATVPEPAAPLWGFADLHTHPAAHLAYGGLLVAGTAAGLTAGGSDVPGGGGTPAKPRTDAQFWSDMDAGCAAYDMGPDPVGHYWCHNTHGYGLQCNRAAAGVVIAGFTTANRAPQPGPKRPYGHFARARLSAPSWYNASHQMMHINWIRRAYEGGLRLLVADAVNNRAITWALLDNPGSNPPVDSDAIERQFQYLIAMAKANASWMEIVLSPAHARRVIAAGKLAVVLGSEVDAFGECNMGPSVISATGANVSVADRCNWSNVLAKLEHFHQMGQRKMNPIHLADNGFGGMAVYSEIFNVGSEWNNRGNPGDICSDPRGEASVCRSSPVPRDADVQYPRDVTNRCRLDSGTCLAGIGWAQVRDGTWQLGTAGFQLPPRMQLLTISLNPFPFYNSDGCEGPSFCASKTEVDVTLPGYGDQLPDVNLVGLTNAGRMLLAEMMRRGMLIDVQHMSDRAINEVLGLVDPGLGMIPGPAGAAGSALVSRGAAACARMDVPTLDANPACRDQFYPVMSSHGGLRFVAGDPIPGVGGACTASGPFQSGVYAAETLPPSQNENARSLEQLRRIYQIGGIVGLGTGGGTVRYSRAYQQAREVTRDAGLAVGSDLNGGDGGATPRLLAWSCMHGPPPSPTQAFVGYQLPPGGTAPVYSTATCSPDRTLRFMRINHEPALKPLALPPKASLPATLRNPAPYDINTDGFANVGMYPDYFQDVRAFGVPRDQLGPLFQSAERFVQMWEASCRIAAGIPGQASAASCLCDPGVAASRGFCPAGSPGLP